MKNLDGSPEDIGRTLQIETAKTSKKKEKSSGVVADRKEVPSGGLKTDLPLSYHRVRALFSYLCNTEITDSETG